MMSEGTVALVIQQIFMARFPFFSIASWQQLIYCRRYQRATLTVCMGESHKLALASLGYQLNL